MTPITVGAVISSQAPRGGLAVSCPRTTLSVREFWVRLRDHHSRLLNGERLARGFLAFRQREFYTPSSYFATDAASSTSCAKLSLHQCDINTGTAIAASKPRVVPPSMCAVEGR